MGYKNVVSTTDASLNVSFTVRQGDDPSHGAGVKTFVVGPHQTQVCTYSNGDNPYLNSVAISAKTSGGILTSVQDVATRGGEVDNALNTNNTITVSKQGVDLVNGYSNK